MNQHHLKDDPNHKNGCPNLQSYGQIQKILMNFSQNSFCGQWKVVGLEKKGHVTRIRIIYLEDEYYNQEVEMVLPAKLVWVLNHETIIKKLMADKIPRLEWIKSHSEWEYQAI